MKSTSKKKSKRKIIYLAVILFIVGVVSVSSFKVVNLLNEKNEAEAKLSALEREKALLEEELEKVGSDEYIEQQAREQLNMIMPGETLYILKENEKDEAE